MVGLIGLLPFFGTTEEPQHALNNFVAMFLAQDSNALLKIIHPEVLSEKEIRLNDVDSFLRRFPAKSLKLQDARVERFKSEDDKTERFKAGLKFVGPVLAPQYPEPSVLNLSLLWVMEDGKWWLERPLSIFYAVSSAAPYPTPEQTETATRFVTALAVLDKLGLPGTEDLQLIEPVDSGTAEEHYKELENLYKSEGSPGGVDPGARGVQVLLKAATKNKGGLLRMYHGDFKSVPEDRRRPLPCDMFMNYVDAAIKHGKYLERRENPKRAETIYRRLVSMGRQLLDEPGGLQFMNCGLAIQKRGAQELARILPSRGNPSREQAQAVANLASRRLDLLQTALSCLDDMADYRSLRAAIIASERVNDQVFRPWGINTLAILALKGAPANPDAVKSAGAMIMVADSGMQKTASMALDKLAAEPSGQLRRFIENQKDWILKHQVYGPANTFR